MHMSAVRLYRMRPLAVAVAAPLVHALVRGWDGCTACAAGQHDDDSHASTACTTCPVGSNSLGGSVRCDDCTAGRADLDDDPSTPCNACPAGAHSATGAASCTACSCMACLNVCTAMPNMSSVADVTSCMCNIEFSECSWEVQAQAQPALERLGCPLAPELSDRPTEDLCGFDDFMASLASLVLAEQGSGLPVIAAGASGARECASLLEAMETHEEPEEVEISELTCDERVAVDCVASWVGGDTRRCSESVTVTIFIASSGWGEEVQWAIDGGEPVTYTNTGLKSQTHEHKFPLEGPVGRHVISFYDTLGDGWHGGGWRVVDNCERLLGESENVTGAGFHLEFETDESTANVCSAECGGGGRNSTYMIYVEGVKDDLDHGRLCEAPHGTMAFEECNMQPCETCADGVLNGHEDGVDCAHAFPTTHDHFHVQQGVKGPSCPACCSVAACTACRSDMSCNTQREAWGGCRWNAAVTTTTTITTTTSDLTTTTTTTTTNGTCEAERFVLVANSSTGVRRPANPMLQEAFVLILWIFSGTRRTWVHKLRCEHAPGDDGVLPTACLHHHRVRPHRERPDFQCRAPGAAARESMGRWWFAWRPAADWLGWARRLRVRLAGRGGQQILDCDRRLARGACWYSSRPCLPTTDIHTPFLLADLVAFCCFHLRTHLLLPASLD